MKRVLLKDHIGLHKNIGTPTLNLEALCPGIPERRDEGRGKSRESKKR